MPFYAEEGDDTEYKSVRYTVNFTILEILLPAEFKISFKLSYIYICYN